MVKLDEQNREDYIRNMLEYLDAGNIDLFRNDYMELHPTDRLEVYHQLLDKEQRQRLYEYLSPEEFAEVFQELDARAQHEYVLELDRGYAVDVLKHMYADDVAAFLTELPEETAESFLRLLNKKDAAAVEAIMSYPEETAGAIMTTEFIALSSMDTVERVMEKLRKQGKDAETIYYLYVVDPGGKLAGVVSLRDLIIAGLDVKMEAIMSTRLISVNAGMDQEEVASIIKKYDFLAVPVVTEEGKLVGIVTVDDVIDVLERETSEDIGELAAVKGAVDLDIGPFQAARKRLPWLIALLFIGMLTAGLMSRFEEQLDQVAALAYFIPLIAGMAGNVGTQSLAVVVRGMALGKLDRDNVFRLIRREIATALMIGIVCGITVALISQVVTKGNFMFGFVVGISLFVTLIVANLAGTIIPMLINKLRIDPAVASGPFITTINDILGLMIYFSIATALISYL